MASDSSGSRSGGIGFLGLLGLLFIGLKLGGVIEWSWLWVLCPLWAPLAIVAAICSFCGCMAVLVAVGEKKKWW